MTGGAVGRGASTCRLCGADRIPEAEEHLMTPPISDGPMSDGATPDGAGSLESSLAAAVAGNDQTGVVQALAGQQLILPQTSEAPEGKRDITLPVIEQDNASY